jgi:hypothetical protein
VWLEESGETLRGNSSGYEGASSTDRYLVRGRGPQRSSLVRILVI